MALDQLRLDMPKASFDTWVHDTSFVSFDDGVFTIGTPNAYGREWLASRLTSIVTRMLTGILNQHVDVQFVVTEGIIEDEVDDPIVGEKSFPDEATAVLSLHAIHPPTRSGISLVVHWLPHTQNTILSEND